MARRTFFSFHFENDIWRANQVRNSNVVVGADVAGFFDHSEYEDAKRRGDAAVKAMIQDHLKYTTVTVVLIGSETAQRPYVQYEIQESLTRKNGLLGIFIDHLQDQSRRTSFRGQTPAVPYGIEFPTYAWDNDVRRFAEAIEAAGRRSDRARGN